MLNFTNRTRFYISSVPSDMRKGGDSLADLVRMCFDLNGYVVYQKWFDDGKLLRPKFEAIKACHRISREEVILLFSNAVQSNLYIYDYDRESEKSVFRFRMGEDHQVSGPFG